MVTDQIHPAKRHCMIVYATYPLSETRVQREAEALIKHGYEVDVICLRDPGDAVVDSYKGVRIYREKYILRLPGVGTGSITERFFLYIRFFISAAIRVTRLNFQKRYNTIQVHNLPDFLVFCTSIPKLLSVPVILDLHDLMPEFFAGRFGQTDSFAARLIRYQEHISCRFADQVITVSEHWKQVLIDRGVPAHKCSVVMNVADENVFCVPNASNIIVPSNNTFRLIYHGGMYQRYGLDLVIQAIDQVRHEIPFVHLTLIGNGDFLPYLMQMVENLGLSQHVTFKPPRQAEELPRIIRSCNIGVVPYRNDVFTDGLLPTKLMEYAALGMPAIAARTTAIEAFFRGTLVEFFEPGSVDDLVCCILKLYNNHERLMELAQGCQNFNRRYNWENISQEYVGLVEKTGNDKAQSRRKTKL